MTAKLMTNGGASMPIFGVVMSRLHLALYYMLPGTYSGILGEEIVVAGGISCICVAPRHRRDTRCASLARSRHRRHSAALAAPAAIVAKARTRKRIATHRRGIHTLIRSRQPRASMAEALESRAGRYENDRRARARPWKL